MPPQDFNFGLTLRCYRKGLGLDQAELAELLDVTQVTISRWEAGIRTPRDPVEIIMKLAELDDVFDDVVEDIIELAVRGDDGRIVLTTYRVDEHWWLADERARDMALPASLHQAATAQAAREIAGDEGTFVTIRSSH